MAFVRSGEIDGFTFIPEDPKMLLHSQFCPKIFENILRTSEGLSSCTVQQQWAPKNANDSLASADSKRFQNVLHAITSIVYTVRLRISRISITAPRGLREAGGVMSTSLLYMVLINVITTVNLQC